MLIYTREQMRIIEENADRAGLSFLQMMDNAGNGCADKINSIVCSRPLDNKSAAILCGKGKNGGDGLVIAGNLIKKGYEVNVVFTDGFPDAYESKTKFKEIVDTSVNFIDFRSDYDASVEICKKSSVIVDCIFGIGFHGKVDEKIASFFDLINSFGNKKIAVDIPSGLDSNTGKVDSACFRADYTLAITCFKPAHILKPACSYCGMVSLIDIGIDRSCYNSLGEDVLVSADYNEIGRFFVKRNPVSHKGDYGRMLSVCGSKNMQGAAVMAAEAAVNSGVGLVTCLFPDAAYSAIAGKLTEPITVGLKSRADGTLCCESMPEILSYLAKSDVVLLGCGLGLTDDTVDITRGVLENASCPVVLDADGLNAASRDLSCIDNCSQTVILTPHVGEMSRLTGISIEDILENPVKIAKDFSSAHSCIVVLKGANTVVCAASGSAYVNRTGNPGMATGGCGDVLAGLIASFIAQSMSPLRSAVAAVYLHGLAGDSVRKKYSMHGVTPTGMIREISELLSNFEG